VLIVLENIHMSMDSFFILTLPQPIYFFNSISCCFWQPPDPIPYPWEFVIQFDSLSLYNLEKSFKMNVFSNKALFEIKLWNFLQQFLTNFNLPYIYAQFIYVATCTVFIQIMNSSSTITTLLKWMCFLIRHFLK